MLNEAVMTETHVHLVKLREVPRIVDTYKRWCAFRPPPPPLPPFSVESNKQYMRTIMSERPPIRLWAEEALYRVRKRQRKTGAMDGLLEEYLARDH